jgi:hypothetical protein
VLEYLDDFDTPSPAAVVGDIDEKPIFATDVPQDATLAQQRRHATAVILQASRTITFSLEHLSTAA